MKIFRWIGMAAVMTLAAGVQAQESTPFNPLTLDYVIRSGFPYAGPALSPLVTGSGFTRYSLNAVKDEIYGAPGEQYSTEELEMIGFSVAPGYQVTRFEFNGVISGSMEVGDASAIPGLIVQYPGSAGNRVRAQFDIIEYGRTYFSFERTDSAAVWFDVEAPTEVSFSISGAWADQFALQASISSVASSWFTLYQAEYGGRWWEGRYPSYASVRIDNPTLSVYYAPIAEVPEPASWMLWLAGLIPLFRGFVRREKEANP